MYFVDLNLSLIHILIAVLGVSGMVLLYLGNSLRKKKSSEEK